MEGVAVVGTAKLDYFFFKKPDVHSKDKKGIPALAYVVDNYQVIMSSGAHGKSRSITSKPQKIFRNTSRAVYFLTPKLS